MNNFKIIHIYHSGFEIHFKDFIIQIDVYDHFKTYKNKKIYCFSTHSHADHYSPKMLEQRTSNDIKFIFSDDIQAVGEDITFVKKGDELTVDTLKIKVFGTTDLGVSYYIQVGADTFFHSGDLNWWHWKADDKKTQESEKIQYQTEVNKIIGLPIQFAFVPVDPRLEEYNRLAMDYFIETLKPDYLIPMHFGNKYESLDDLTTTSDTILLKSKKMKSTIF